MPLRDAMALESAGRDDEAKAAYLAHLSANPDDAAALLALGNLLFRTGYRSAARTAYARAVQVDGTNLSARVNLANTLLELGDLPAAACEYTAALRYDEQFAPAHQGLSYVYARLGDERRSLEHRERGFTGSAVSHAPCRGTGTPLRLLVFYAAAGGNFSTEWLLDAKIADVHRVAAEYADPNEALPAHDAIVNAIGDADLCAGALDAAERLIEKSDAPVLNAPARVALTGRERIARQLAGIPGLHVPSIARVTRTELCSGNAGLRERGFDFPLLLRAPGHNTGRHFVKADAGTDLAAAAAALPGDELFAIAFADVRSADGFFRKYRIVRVGGTIVPIHAALSRSWKVHQFSAFRESVEAGRAEDRRFIADPQSVIGAEAMRTVRRIFDTLQLDYGGVDFGIGRDGRVVLFEANATMSILPTAGDPEQAYRSGVFTTVQNAFISTLREALGAKASRRRR